MKAAWPSWATPIFICKTVAIVALMVYIIHAPIEFFHHIMEVLHIVYESIAFVIEEFLHHVFHLNKFQSQLIVFYGSWMIGLFVIYRLWKGMPSFWQRQQDRFYIHYLRLKIVATAFWGQANWIDRIKLMLIQMGLMAGAFMFVLG